MDFLDYQDGEDSVYEESEQFATCQYVSGVIKHIANQVISFIGSWGTKDVSRFWRLWQFALGTSQFCSNDELLDIIGNDPLGRATDFGRLLKFLEKNAHVFELKESAKDVKGREDEDLEKKFIEDHRDELMKWCPIDLSLTKQRWQMAKDSGQLELQAYYYYLYYVAQKYGYFPQSWEKMEEFSSEITSDEAVESLEKLNKEYSTTELDSRLCALSVFLDKIKDKIRPLSSISGLIKDLEETKIE